MFYHSFHINCIVSILGFDRQYPVHIYFRKRSAPLAETRSYLLRKFIDRYLYVTITYSGYRDAHHRRSHPLPLVART